MNVSEIDVLQFWENGDQIPKNILAHAQQSIALQNLLAHCDFAMAKDQEDTWWLYLVTHSHWNKEHTLIDHDCVVKHWIPNTNLEQFANSMFLVKIDPYECYELFRSYGCTYNLDLEKFALQASASTADKKLRELIQMKK